ncbi:hypothetical protein [Actinoplanes sp. NPDC020271]|uniref:hypothetical protein n=1 Tax=Actinoplanes sp. NPDC020271 TaxID=3363896 RepID=UPI0037922881
MLAHEDNSDTIVPVKFFCEHSSSKSRVFVLLKRHRHAQSLHAVLSCTDRVLAHRVARILNRAAESGRGKRIATEGERIAALLPVAPASSFRQALDRAFSQSWPEDRVISVGLGELLDSSQGGSEESDSPDFRRLFLIDEDDEDWQLTPRTAYVLHAALSTLSDWAYDDVNEHGDEPVKERDSGDWYMLDRLPRLSWRQDAQWRRQIARAADDLCQDLESGQWPIPRCNAEELCLHLAIEDAQGIAEIYEDDPALTEDLPAHPDDFDWETCSEDFFQDHDVLLLDERWADGIEDPDGDLNMSAGIGDLRPQNWFRWFDNVSPRDRHRGFRR